MTFGSCTSAMRVAGRGAAKLIHLLAMHLRLLRRERLPESLAHLRSVEARIVALLRPARCDLEVGEHRSRLGQYGADLLLEHLEVGEFIDRAIPGGSREARKIDLLAARNRMPAVRFVGAVLAYEMDEI